MDDILKQFLIEAKKELEVQPFDFFPLTNATTESSGILPFFYLKWASTQHLLLKNDEISKVTASKNALTSKLISIREILGEQLLPAHFNSKGSTFTQKYYRPGWTYFYLTDFSNTFPEHDDLDWVTDTEINYKKISIILEDRFFKWQSKS
ncbi:hypothetical protein HX810_06515 [Pseudomonas salomonii]|uniref:DUF7832 domain-containing protein n=1 Tax=Pseudomonas salomonii TaxID=191391 RepID=A0A7Y8KMI4_9PSED|nr:MULTISPECIES: hypothetical protein [Pseudomonas]NWF07315.1 hypothetical protein [Pseudomonas salomonii]CRM52144.1 hypothetical protein [Pseudomonas sp. 58 R 3]